MLIAETRSFPVGRFTVWQKPRFDSPAWPQYIIYLAGRLIGKSFSRPDEQCCERLEKYGPEAVSAAMESAMETVKAYRTPLRGVCKERRRTRRNKEPAG
jgi:hypothetical protein